MSEDRAVVFVVDDDASIRRSLDTLISSVGHDVRLFSSTEEFMQAERPDAPGCLVPGRNPVPGDPLELRVPIAVSEAVTRYLRIEASRHRRADRRLTTPGPVSQTTERMP